MTELPDAIMNTPIGDSIRRRWGSLWHLDSAATAGNSEARAWIEQPATMSQVYEAQPPSDYEGTTLAQQPSNQPPTGSMAAALRDYARDNAPTPVVRVRTRVEDISTPAAAPTGPPQPVEAGAALESDTPTQSIARSTFSAATGI